MKDVQNGGKVVAVAKT
ncbi:hypothetical protein CGCA056_v001221 [Colletotrichum aenigma]|nr:hypothetical protein CGCA056_v001221 [Colletotrichum aenigma]